MPNHKKLLIGNPKIGKLHILIENIFNFQLESY